MLKTSIRKTDMQFYNQSNAWFRTARDENACDCACQSKRGTKITECKKQ